jgi:hypothetical protein
MFRKIALVVVLAFLVFSAACSSKSSGTTATGTGATGAALSATSCPTSSTVKFAKTKFVADAALAGGAFKRYIYTPAKEGKFKKGANGRTFALIKAAAAGAFAINRLDAAFTAAKADPTLCKLLAAPIAKFKSAIATLVSKVKSGDITPGDVSNPADLLDNVRNAATQGGAGFVDNLKAQVG